MLQGDLFAGDASEPSVAPRRELARRRDDDPLHEQVGDAGEPDLPAVLALVTEASARPRYTFMVLNLIARVADPAGKAGPYVRHSGRAIGIRDWLSDAMMPVARRDPRRAAVVNAVREELLRSAALPSEKTAAEEAVGREVRRRLRRSGRTNVSRAVSDLVRAGLLRRHYQGYRVNHENRGAQREAVYTISPLVRQALRGAA